MKDNILKEYTEKKYIFEKLSNKLEALIGDILEENKIIIHQLSSRVKEERSLSDKIDIKDGKYQCLNDITDIVGIRIITYLDSDVDTIAEMIKKEFNIDEENSVDKRKLDNDVFGYRSLHYVASFKEERCNLTEFKPFKDIKFEIQIRSILQHAWAEIEHDLGYKSAVSVPDNFIRSFNRLSALLETADIEFDRLKKDLKSYEVRLPQLIENTPNDIEINQASIISFANNNQVNQNAISIIQSTTNCVINNITSSEILLKQLNFLDITTIGKLDMFMTSYKEKYLLFVKECTLELYNQEGVYPLGISILTPLFYLCFYIALDRNVYDEMMKKTRISNDKFASRSDIAFKSAYNKVNPQ
ncbi:GTP pyrophosphokinase family protein [Bacteroides finegoldii]|uniref:GTP pyrophosphokinase n=1 Tax=Bacteroides finegoldii TaxID=338188 RepID=UPI00189B5407|nr:(p)ppGpp synthetase [Bacteroides finegoldii]